MVGIEFVGVFVDVGGIDGFGFFFVFVFEEFVV